MAGARAVRRTVLAVTVVASVQMPEPEAVRMYGAREGEEPHVEEAVDVAAEGADVAVEAANTP